MTTDELRALTRNTVLAVRDKGGPEGILDTVAPVRAALAERGLAPMCHVGCGELTPDEIVEWYAGQLLAIVDAEAWHAVNTLINVVDRFAPADAS